MKLGKGTKLSGAISFGGTAIGGSLTVGGKRQDCPSCPNAGVTTAITASGQLLVTCAGCGDAWTAR